MAGDVSAVMDLVGGTVTADTAAVWLAAATAVADRYLGGDAAVSVTVRNRVEEHLAAHYIEMGGGRTKVSERLPDWAVSYAQGKDGVTGLASTRNGQIAIALDPTGTLAELSKPIPRFAVL